LIDKKNDKYSLRRPGGGTHEEGVAVAGEQGDPKGWIQGPLYT